jgi:hypothetical protein
MKLGPPFKSGKWIGDERPARLSLVISSRLGREAEQAHVPPGEQNQVVRAGGGRHVALLADIVETFGR